LNTQKRSHEQTPKDAAKPVKLWQATLPIVFLLLTIIYGLLLRPRVFEQKEMPLEIIFLLSAVFAIGYLMLLGYSWQALQDSIVAKISRVFPALMVLFAIGLIIGSWIVAGTIPMLVYYGIKLIHPDYIYVLSFLLPIIFSTLVGTSWGSIGTIGIVLIGVASAIDAHLGITAGAIVGGAYFGDKVSPLSDTTNVAAMAVEIPLYAHIRSMMYTTLPSALIAAIVYFVLGYMYPPAAQSQNFASITNTLQAIQGMFNFSVFLLIPPLIVLYGSLRKMPTLPVLLVSSLAACVLALMLQRFDSQSIIATMYKGFNTDMAGWLQGVPANVKSLFNRGGLYQLSEPVIISLMVFIYIGAIDKINAMALVINTLLRNVHRRSGVILASLFSTAFTNVMTCNQNVTGFVIGDAFKDKYDQLGISRKVLSRSLEDYGTMLESIVPWTPTAIFVVATLQVPFGEYWHWQLLTLINLVVAPLLAITGIGCFYNQPSNTTDEKLVH